MATQVQIPYLPRLAFTRLLFWGVVLLMSALPNILWREATGQANAWWLQVKLLGLIAVLGLSWLAKKAEGVRPLVLILLIVLVAEWAMAQVGATGWWRSWFQGEGTFVTGMMSIQFQRLLVSFVLLAVLLGLKRSPRALFLMPGDMHAPAQPVALLGMKKAESWRRFGVTSVLIMSGVLLTFLFLAGRPSPALLLSAVPLLPFVLLFALMNAWSEEITYRVALIATTEPVVGATQALWMSAIVFGIGHYYGVPYGIAGVLLSTFFGYLLGKSVLETRGLAWAWILHVVADIWIFSFMAVGSVTPGG